ARGPEEGVGLGVAGATEAAGEGAGRPEVQRRRAEGPVAEREERRAEGARGPRADRAGETPDRTGRAAVRPEPRRRVEVRQAAGAGATAQGDGGGDRPVRGRRPPAPEGGSRRGGHRGRCQSLDRRPGDQAAGGGKGEAAPPGGRAAQAGDRSGRG